MKIVVLVDYSSSQFNKDFNFSNMLIERGHNVFLAVNDDQFKYFKDKCDLSIKGYSWKGTEEKTEILLTGKEPEEVVNSIENKIFN